MFKQQWFLFCVVFTWLLPASVSVHAQEYKVEPCCELCPAARDITHYNTSLLKVVRLLVDGRDGWLFRTENDFKQEFGPSDENLAELAKFVQLLNRQGVQLAFFYIPTRGLVHPDHIIDHRSVGYNWAEAKQSYLTSIKRFRDVGIIVADMDAFFKAPHANYFFQRDHHWSPVGSKISAELLSKSIKRSKIYDGLEQTEFANKKIGVLRRNGQLQNAAKQLCGFDYPSQYVEEFEAERVTSAEVGENAVDSLFGDSALPEVVLLGTSNSKGRQNYNFEGYLKEYLSLDMYNEAVEGGGFDSAMIQYLHSELYQQDKPKLIVWEMPSYYDLNEELFFRRVKALTQNGCADRPTKVESTTTLKIGKNEVLFNGNGQVKDLRSGNLIVDFQFEDKSVRDIKLDVWYINGRKESIRIEDSERIDTKGRFVFELNSSGDWKDLLYMSMDLNIDEKEGARRPLGKVSAKLCEKTY